MSTYQSPILILTGMHRSGTSLLSSLLQSAGVNIGQKLVPANDGNPKGYFENADFVNFHEEVLFSLGIDKIGWTTQEKIIPPLEYVHEAKKLIEINQDFEKPWGWKEPRTSLFLDFWSDLLPCAHFIFVYRCPWEVIDSLYRRGDDIFRKNPEFALQVWSVYNRAIANFYLNHQEKCILINLAEITCNPNCLVEMINNKFNLSLPSVDSNLYDPDSLKTEAKKSQRPYLIKSYFPDIWQQYQELNSLSGYKDFWQDELENLPINAWLLQDWLNVRLLDKTLKREKELSDQHLDSVYQELGVIKGEKEKIEFVLNQSQQQLSDTQQQLSDTQTQLSDTQTQLYQSQQHLEETLSQLYKTQQQFKNTQNQLEETQSRLDLTLSELIQSQEQLNNTQFQLQQTQEQLQDKKYELQEKELGFKELHFYFERSQEELKQTQEKLKEKEEYLCLTKMELENSQEKILGMKSSKFWKLRNKWFAIKGGEVD